MMKTIFIIIVNFIHLTAILQNLVPNYSFEEFIECPSQMNYNVIPLPWLSPTNNSVDYFHSCSDIRGVPYHGNDFQFAKTGEGYVGIWVFSIIGTDYREYIQIKLQDTLINNTCYYIEFFTNPQSGLTYFIKNIDAHLSNDEIPTTNSGFVLNLESHIHRYNNDFIQDTMNWTKIAGIYTANGGENFLTIGNFKFNDSTDTLFTGTKNFLTAYYYIDDVSVIPINPNTMPANAGEDKLVAPGDSVFIGQEISNLNCTWRLLDGTVLATNISGIYVKPNQKTTYVVEQNLCGVISYDTVVVSVGYLGLENEKESENDVRISPNPNSGSFTLQTNGIAIQQLTLYDAQGRKINELDKNSTKFELNLPKGLYFIEIISEKNRNIEKIVVN